jgi:hypothetical protein
MATPTRRRPLFAKRDAERAVKAARSAGIPNPRLMIAPDGTITVAAGAPQEIADPNPWLEAKQ